MGALISALVAMLAATLTSTGLVRQPADTDQPVTLVGHALAGVERLMYAPGQARTADPGGLHTVLVTAGTLTVCGDDGECHRYQAGQGFAAGWQPYVVKNDTTRPAEAMVTLQKPAGHR